MSKISVEATEKSEYVVPESRSATKTDTPLRDVPQSITVVTGELIQDQSMQNLADVARYVPGAGMAQGEGNRDTIILRGNSSTADFFVDGVRDDVEYFRDLYNVDRVEASEGPERHDLRTRRRGRRHQSRDAPGRLGPRARSVTAGGIVEQRSRSFDVGDGVNESRAACTGMYEELRKLPRRL